MTDRIYEKQIGPWDIERIRGIIRDQLDLGRVVVNVGCRGDKIVSLSFTDIQEFFERIKPGSAGMPRALDWYAQAYEQTNQELTATKIELHVERRAKDIALATNEDLIQKYDRLKAEHDREFDQYRQRLAQNYPTQEAIAIRAELKETTEYLRVKQDELNDLQRRFTAMSTDHERLQTELRSTKDQLLKALGGQYDKIYINTSPSYSDVFVAGLQGRLKKVENSHDALTKMFDKAIADLKEAQATSDHWCKVINKDTEEIHELRTQLQLCRAELITAQGQVKLYKDAGVNVNDSYRQAAKEELAKVTQEWHDARNGRLALEILIGEKDKAIEDLSAKLKSVQTKLEDELEQHERTVGEANRWSAKWRGSDDTVKAQLKKINELADRVIAQDQRIESLSLDCNRLANELAKTARPAKDNVADSAYYRPLAFGDKVRFRGSENPFDWGIITTVGDGYDEFGTIHPPEFGVTWRINRASGTYTAYEIERIPE